MIWWYFVIYITNGYYHIQELLNAPIVKPLVILNVNPYRAGTELTRLI